MVIYSFYQTKLVSINSIYCSKRSLAEKKLSCCLSNRSYDGPEMSLSLQNFFSSLHHYIYFPSPFFTSLHHCFTSFPNCFTFFHNFYTSLQTFFYFPSPFFYFPWLFFASLQHIFLLSLTVFCISLRHFSHFCVFTSLQ